MRLQAEWLMVSVLVDPQYILYLRQLPGLFSPAVPMLINDYTNEPAAVLFGASPMASLVYLYEHQHMLREKPDCQIIVGRN